MKAVQIMMEEHQNILRMLKVIRTACYKIYRHEEFDYDKFYNMIDFIRNYADKHHHSKEEEVLFKEMSNNIAQSKEPIQGMFIDHDNGRNFIRNLEAALENKKKGEDEAHIDIISNAVAYAELLSRHINKEDNVIYNFGERHLPEDIKGMVDNRCDEIDYNASEEGIQDKYISILIELEKNFGIN